MDKKSLATLDDDIGPVPTASRTDRIASELYENETGRSNFVAFLMGGVVIAGGMLAFLFYDGSSSVSDPRDNMTTGSLVRMDGATPQKAPNISLTPRAIEPQTGRAAP